MKQFCLCLLCLVPIHRACCGVNFPRGVSPTWKEFSIAYKCSTCIDVADPVTIAIAVAIAVAVAVAVAVADAEVAGRPKRKSPSGTPPVTPPHRKRKGQPRIADPLILISPTDLPTICRRENESDGIRHEPSVELCESILEQSSFEEPTMPNYKIHNEGSNKGKVKFTNGLGT
ncbi:Uncharacterized protein APZ42_028936 [Daphnia magna]|uniref:Uncharacterized protein n=1 Tax=Daphnia magna TaxID=35525 RepID=A0A164Q2N0_9CRUS|nr:Uncharacterized protein APZ42_028936 [Daphnia magna]